MTEYSEEQQSSRSAEEHQQQPEEEEEKEEFKIYIGRVPTKFTEKNVKRILVEKLGGSSAGKTSKSEGDTDTDTAIVEKDAEKEHRGFGFVSFATAELRDAALKLGTIKAGRKKTSKRLHTMHLRPYVPIADAETLEDVCYLWSLKRCPYGNECKFRHIGEGGCLQKEEDMSPEEQKQLRRKRKGKCFTYKKKGKCPKGDDCPFSHDFEPDAKHEAKKDSDNKKSGTSEVPKSEKDCINWKTKGKCRKGDKCEYKHDPEVQRLALEKIAKKKKRQRDGGETNDDEDGKNNKKRRKEKQPISVRVFGLNYDTTEADVKEFIETAAGHPVKTIVFPRFEDSGRSKGYCGVYFASPKAAADAVAKCDGAELHGRWLRVQTGKSMTVDQWEGLHHK
eukprot:jgi/Psemu1/255521/estExt_Genewise1Plus.C_1430069